MADKKIRHTSFSFAISLYKEYRGQGIGSQLMVKMLELLKLQEGVFLKNVKRCMFTINHTKKIYYNLTETDILFQNHIKNDFSDPLPILMGYGSVAEPGNCLEMSSVFLIITLKVIRLLKKYMWIGRNYDDADIG